MLYCFICNILQTHAIKWKLGVEASAQGGDGRYDATHAPVRLYYVRTAKQRADEVLVEQGHWRRCNVSKCKVSKCTGWHWMALDYADGSDGTAADCGWVLVEDVYTARMLK